MIQSAGPVQALAYIALFLVVMTALKVGTSYLGSYFLIPIRTGVLRDLRRQLYDKILSLPLGFFSDERKGDIMARMTGDVNEVEYSIMSSLDLVFKNPVMIVMYLAVMFSISWELTIFALIFLPVAGTAVGRIGKSLKRKSKAGQEQTGELLSQIEETLGGLRVVKAFNAEGKLAERFAQLNERLRRTFNRINRRQALAHPVSELLGTMVIAVLLCVGGLFILRGTGGLTGETFIYYLTIFYLIINPAKELSKATYSIQKGLASVERVDKILQAESDIREPAAPARLTGFTDRIEYRGVWFRYQNDWVLRDVNLTVPKGKTVALVGQSGSGKSTLVDLLPRFYDPQRGAVTIDGVDLRDLRTRDLRALMGNVNQEAILFNDTFYNNITFGVEHATREQVEEAARIANAHDFIMASEHGYDTVIGDRGGKLSGGQRQRISIARAILKNPHPHPRRGHLGPGHRVGENGAAGAREPHAQPHHAGGGAPPLHHPQGRRNLRDARGANRGTRPPRGAGGARRLLQTPGGHAVVLTAFPPALCPPFPPRRQRTGKAVIPEIYFRYIARKIPL